MKTDTGKTETEAGKSELETSSSAPTFPPEGTIVSTDLGLAGMRNGQWFKWWPEMKCFGRKAMTAAPSWWQYGDSDNQSKQTITPHKTGLGSTAWRATEPDAPGLFAFVYDARRLAIPLAPETDDITFVVISEETNETLAEVVVRGREGLNIWYLTNVGHEPDKEPDGPLPIMRLIDNVAAHLLLEHFDKRRLPNGE